MADWVKIALKTGLVLGVMTGIWAIFTQIQIPSLNFGWVFNGFATGFAIMKYWFPEFPVIWNFTLILLGILVALWTFRFGSVAVRWLFKVNE